MIYQKEFKHTSNGKHVSIHDIPIEQQILNFVKERGDAVTLKPPHVRIPFTVLVNRNTTRHKYSNVQSSTVFVMGCHVVW
jgi:hypothetical protein